MAGAVSPRSNALVERLDVPGRLIATPGDRMAASGTSRMKWLVDVWIAAAILLMAIGGAGAQPKSGDPATQAKQVLFLYSLGPNFQPWATWGKAIREEMNRQSPWPLNVQEYSLVSALTGNDIAGVEFVEYLMALYAERKPDLIVAIGHLRLASSSSTGQTCFRRRRCCSRQSKFAGLNNRCWPNRTPLSDARRPYRSHRQHSAAVAGDKDHIDDHRQLST